MDNHARLTYLPSHYYELQTLRFAPLWIASLASLVYNAHPGHWIPHGPAGRTLPSLGLLAIEVLWYWMTMRYYRWRLGQLEVNLSLHTIGFNWWMLYLVLGNCAHFSWSETPYAWRNTPWPSGLLIAFFMLVYVLILRTPFARRAVYATGGAVVVAVSILSSFHGWNARAFIATVCLTALALGLADHLLLMSLRKPLQEEANA
jgi:hypothetical protein